MERILVVDDSVMQAAVLQNILRDTYEVQLCHDPSQCVAQAKCFEPHLVLLDIIMPKLSGFEVLPLLQAHPETKDIPVILISSMSDVGHEEQGLSLGAVDYIVKPYNKEIVRARVRTHIRIYNLQRSMAQMMRTDALTGVFNRRYLEDVGGEAWLRCKESGLPFSVAMIDVDFFKTYNDCYGHVRGDSILRWLAQTAKNYLSCDADYIARYGGEEFLVGMPDTPFACGCELANRICEGIAQARIAHEQSPLGGVLTVSIGGLTKVPQDGETLGMWIERADAMLYEAKRGGRNRVVWTDVLLTNEVVALHQ